MKILIADDNKISRMTLQEYLIRENHTVLFAEDGVQAYRLWGDENPDVLFTDIMMPEMDGIELIRKIRMQSSNKYTFIIAITSLHDEFTFSESFEAGADDFIIKPFSIVELKNRLIAGKRIVSLNESKMVLYALGQILEARDVETGQHIERVAALSKVIAITLKNNFQYKEVVNRAYIENLELSSTLHDIGKVGICDALLRKPGKYTEEERERMKAHSTIGHEIIEHIRIKYPNADFLQIASEVTWCHHECYDGSGYPRGISGEDIPLSARIVALADVYDALRSKRVYKVEMTHENAKQEILKMKGFHFDPVIVDAFLQSEKQFQKIY